MSLRGILEFAFVGWLLIALAVVHEVRRDQEREFKRYVSAVCTDGVPPPDFHGRNLDRVLQGALGDELLTGCEFERRRFEAMLAEIEAKEGRHWRSEGREATWQTR